MKIERIQLLSIILFIGAFLYFFELYYHGFEIGDISPVQIILTFSVLLLSSVFLFGYQLLEKKIKKKSLLEALAFFGLTIAFLFLVFYPRTFNQTLSLSVAVIYFVVAVVLIVKKDLLTKLKVEIDLDHPWIKFAYRFFIILGILILPASIYQYYASGSFDFRFASISMPMIEVVTVFVQFFLRLMNINTIATFQQGGYTLAVADGSYRVFVGTLCSGITSMTIFIAAFIAMAWDVKANLKRKTGIFTIGIFGTFLSNLIRALILFLVGFYFGLDTLVAVHTHLGWIIYFLWITLFWIVAFRFLEKETADKNLKS
jgi:exosortase/archaeosortase family protein